MIMLPNRDRLCVTLAQQPVECMHRENRFAGTIVMQMHEELLLPVCSSDRNSSQLHIACIFLLLDLTVVGNIIGEHIMPSI